MNAPVSCGLLGRGDGLRVPAKGGHVSGTDILPQPNGGPRRAGQRWSGSAWVPDAALQSGSPAQGQAAPAAPVAPGRAEVDPRLWSLVLAAEAGAGIPSITMITPNSLLSGQLGPSSGFVPRTYESLQGPAWLGYHGNRTALTRGGKQNEDRERAEVHRQLLLSLQPLSGVVGEEHGPTATLYNVQLATQGTHFKLTVVRVLLTQVVTWWACHSHVVPQKTQGGGWGVGVGVAVPLDL